MDALRAVGEVMDEIDLIKRITKKREDYETELGWHRFLLDAFSGGGGFEGRVKEPIRGYWGSAAAIYARASIAVVHENTEVDTYLDPYAREDVPKFKGRVGSAHYTNVVEPVVDIRLSYLHRKPVTRKGFELIEKSGFLQDATGTGTTWDRLLQTVIHPRAEVLGWCPVLFDVDAQEDVGEITRAEAKEQGLRPRACPLLPANLFDWTATPDDGLVAVKVGTWFEERPVTANGEPDLLQPTITVHRVAIWTATSVRWWEIAQGADKKETIRAQGEQPNPWGRIPLVIWRYRPVDEDPVRGRSYVRTIARLAKKLFNYESDLDESLRSTAFPILQVPVKGTPPNKRGSLTVGAGNGLPLPMESSRDYKYIQPDASNAAVYETRIQTIKKDVSRIARTDYSTSDVEQTQSGVSRAFSFENMNRALSDTAGAYAVSEQEALQLVMLMEGATPEEADKGRVNAPTKFDVEDMDRELTEALQARGLDLGPTAIAEMNKRLVRLLLPNLEQNILDKIDGEIEDGALAAEQERAAMRDMRMNPPEPGNAPPDGDEGGPPPAKKPPAPQPAAGG